MNKKKKISRAYVNTDRPNNWWSHTLSSVVHVTIIFLTKKEERFKNECENDDIKEARPLFHNILEIFLK